MTKIYLELDEKQAKFFEYSKDPKDGFEKNESTNGKISYRKYHKEGIKGVLKFVNEREDEFPTGKVKKLSLIVDNSDTRYYLNFQILTAKGNMNQFVEQLIPFMPNLKQGESYRFFPYEMPSEYVDKNGITKTALNKGVSIHKWDLASDTKGDKVERAHSFASKEKGGDIPAIKWDTVEDMGVSKSIKDDRERRNYLYKILQASLTPDSSAGTQNPPATKEEPKAPETKTEAPSAPKTTEYPEEEHDDLPF